MGRDSQIEWTNHTFNPWWGCAKVSPACEHCYAEAWAKRVGSPVWGARAPRRFFGEKHWGEPLAWNEAAGERGGRSRVFCASMADVFEQRADLDPWRERLWGLIEATPNLDWLLLSKRPEHAAGMVPWGRRWPANVWFGATAEDQAWADRRIPVLLESGAAVRFLSCEPLLGRIDLSRWVAGGRKPGIHWVIAGGESGPKSRAMRPEWVRELRDFCARRRIAFHFKQWGHWIPADQLVGAARPDPGVEMIAMGKKAAGRRLDGETFDGLPASAGLRNAG